MTISCSFINGVACALPSPPPAERVALQYYSQEKELEKYVPREQYKQQMCHLVLGCSQIRSISFIPIDNSPQCLYMQRSAEEALQGFVTSEEGSPFPISRVDDENSIVATTRGMDAYYSGAARAILSIFLKDQTTRAISLTFPNWQGSYDTRIWRKCSEVEFSR